MKFHDKQIREEDQLVIMGDNAYLKDNHLTFYHKSKHMMKDYIKWNLAMKYVRNIIECNYGACG